MAAPTNEERHTPTLDKFSNTRLIPFADEVDKYTCKGTMRYNEPKNNMPKLNNRIVFNRTEFSKSARRNICVADNGGPTRTINNCLPLGNANGTKVPVASTPLNTERPVAIDVTRYEMRKAPGLLGATIESLLVVVVAVAVESTEGRVLV